MKRLALLIAVCVASSGCATLFSSSDQPVSFTSEPAGATVMINSVPIGRTPTTVVLDRQTFGNHVITITAPGYQSRAFRLGKTINNVAILNLSCLWSWVTDAISGAMIEYSPGAYYLELPRNDGATRPPGVSAALRFTLVNSEHLLTEIARGDGEFLLTLADLMAVDDYRAFVSALRAELPVLLAREYPYQVHAEIARIAAASRA